MAISDRDLEMMRAGYALWNDGDVEGMVERCLAEDVEFYPDPDWPGLSSVYRGPEEVATFLRDEVTTVIELRGIEIEREMVFGNEVVFGLRATVHGERSGVHLEMVSVFHVARVQEGRVKRIRAFVDESRAIKAAKAG